jgi:excisionase family DNA binding protein
LTRDLSTTVSVEVAGALLGISRTTAYRLAASGEFPVSVLKVGRQLRVPTALLADVLGLRQDEVSDRVEVVVRKPAEANGDATEETSERG